MATSIYQQIVTALVARLAGIVGDGGTNYWYTPDAVYAVSWLSELALKSDKAVKYLVIPDDIEKHNLTFTRTGGRARLDLVLGKRIERPGDDPASSAETRWQIQNKLAQDAEKRIRGDYTQGGLSLHTEIPVIDLSAENTHHESWALVFMHLEIQFDHADSTP